MRRRAARAVSCLLIAWVVTAAAAQDEGAGPEAPRADRALLEEIVRTSGVATEVSQPSVADYPRDLGARFVAWLLQHGEGLRLGPAAFRVLNFVAWGVVIVLTAGVLSLLLRAGLAWRRRRLPSVTATTASILPPAVVAAARTSEDWRLRVEDRLAADDARGALHALWWWLASRLVGAAVEPAWTTRELVLRAGRRELATQVRALDRLLYGGPAEPSTVRALWMELQGVVR